MVDRAFKRWAVTMAGMRFAGMGSDVAALLAAGALSMFAPLVAAAEIPAWTTSADARFAVLRDQASAWPAQVGHARIWPQSDAAKPAVLVTTETGAAVGTKVLWSAPGEPLDVLFDTSGGANAYLIYLGEHGLDGAPAWDPQAGVVLETRRFAEQPIDTRKQFDEAWAKAAPVLGRSLVPHVFDGIHRHGPTTFFCSHYRGCFALAKGGSYGFATLSDDGSFVDIDGRQVAEWPGYHGLDGGQRGEHGAALELAAGRHVVDYWHFQGTGGCTAELAWKPPGADRFEVMPATAFLPVASYSVTRAERRDGLDLAAFSWVMAGHTTVGGELGGPAMVDVLLRITDQDPARKTAHWTFDDGTVADGAEVTHTFARVAPRAVSVSVAVAGKAPATHGKTIAVRPQWLQAEDFPEQRWLAQRKALLARDLAAMPAEDLGATVLYADTLHDYEMLAALAAPTLKRAKEFAGEQAQMLLALGFDLQHPEVRQYQAARQALAACVAADRAPPQLLARAHLHLGGLLVHGFLDQAAATEQLGAVAADQLSGDDQRLLKMYQGDAMLLGGDVDGARKRYLSAGTAGAPNDVKYAVQRRNRLEAARDYIGQGDYDAAEGMVRGIEWETPVERMGTETGLLLAKVWTARKELPFALSRCKLMLISAPDDARRPDVLFALVQIHLAAGHEADAAIVAKQLIADHPYSEAAARVKDLGVARGGKP